MKTFDILDCTLRDGGYYTDWDFSNLAVDTYFAAMRSLPVTHVEVGYRSPAKSGYYGRFFHLSRSTLETCRASLRDDQHIALMFNFKDITPDRIEPMLSDVTDLVKTVRFACPPQKVADCVALGRIVKSLGLDVAVNIMYMGSWVDDPEPVLRPLADSGDVVDHVALVDSYGSVMPDQARSAVARAVSMVPQRVGYHGHDNLSLAFANALAALEGGAQMLDSTILGMGRGAGNLKTELIALYLNSQSGQSRPLGPVAHALQMFEEMQTQYGWGTNLAYMVSGLSKLPQADVMDWLGTRRYQMDTIIEALLLKGDAPRDDTPYSALPDTAFARAHCGRPVVIIGGGQSVAAHHSMLVEFALATDAVIIHSSLRHAGLFENSGVAQLFCLAGQELQRLPQDRYSLFTQPNCEIVTTTPPRFMRSVPDTGNISQVPGLMGEVQLGPVPDEPPLDLAISAARGLRATRLFLAGFDGYPEADLAQQRNAHDVAEAVTRARMPGQSWGEDVVSLTPTLYDVPVCSVHAEIQPGARE